MARSLSARFGASRRGWGLGAALLCAASGLPACGSDPADDGVEPAGGAAGMSGASASAGSGGSQSSGGSAGGPPAACEYTEDSSTPSMFTHLVPCSAVTYDTNPPSGGNHYQAWAAFQNYDYPVPPGFLVHSLEHGAVVFWYNCPDGCADEVAEAVAMIDALPADPLCAGQGVARRTILVPSPELDARWAASSWGFLTKGDCFDAGVLREFYTAHVGQGREALCVPGADLTAGACP